MKKRDENQNFNDTKFTTAIVISRGEGLVFVEKSIQNLEKNLFSYFNDTFFWSAHCFGCWMG